MSFLSTISRIAQPHEPVSGDALRDLGLTRDEVKALQYARPETRQQLESMALRFGLSPQDLGADRWRALDVSLACAKCSKARACANFLTDRGAFDTQECPNAPTYLEMVAEKQSDA